MEKANLPATRVWRAIPEPPMMASVSFLQSPNGVFAHFQTCRCGRRTSNLPYSSGSGMRQRALTYSIVPHRVHEKGGTCTG